MPSTSRSAQRLIVAAFLCVVGLAAWYGRVVWADSGPFVLVLFGIPAACTAIALWAERTSRTMLAPGVLAVLAAVCLAWSSITALGIGLVFVVPSSLLLVAAVVSWSHRTRRDSSASARP